MTAQRIVLTTFGSYGDLHPYLALALGLRARGHDCLVATSPMYKDKVEALGLPFAPMRPDAPDFKTQPDLMPYLMDLKRGTERIVREFMMPALRESYDDLMAATRPGDVLVSHGLTYATRVVAEKRALLWISAALQPMTFFSAFDAPVLPPVLWLERFRPLPPRVWRVIFRIARLRALGWDRPWHELRARAGLPPLRGVHPLFEGQHSPHLALALFSRHLATPQTDWPDAAVTTGFPFFDHDGDPDLAPELRRFLDAGDAPIVFTLGTAAVYDAGAFYAHSLQAARTLGRRAVLLVGKEIQSNRDGLPPLDPAREIAVDYAPFSRLFPRAAIVVHQGGVGTTGQAMLAGRPMLVTPYAHDQPDNAARVTRLGIARTIPRRSYDAARAVTELGALARDPAYERNAARIGQLLAAENGVAVACDAIEWKAGLRAPSTRQPYAQPSP